MYRHPKSPRNRQQAAEALEVVVEAVVVAGFAVAGAEGLKVAVTGEAFSVALKEGGHLAVMEARVYS
ncbi:MAG: hypothetical protein SGPRY_004891 [Prymnesium sp.]